jgi:hypothetical protein
MWIMFGHVYYSRDVCVSDEVDVQFPRCLRPRKDSVHADVFAYTQFPMSALVDTSIMVEDMSFFYPEGLLIGRGCFSREVSVYVTFSMNLVFPDT